MVDPAQLEPHTAWVLGWFRRRFGADRAEDLAQEAFVAVLRNSHRLERDRVGAYLLGVVRTLSKVECRRRGGMVQFAEEPVADDPAAPGENVLAAVRELPPELEQVVTLHYAEQRSYDEVAALLGVPRATVQSRLRRALERLRRTLGKKENVS